MTLCGMHLDWMLGKCYASVVWDLGTVRFRAWGTPFNCKVCNHLKQVRFVSVKAGRPHRPSLDHVIPSCDLCQTRPVGVSLGGCPAQSPEGGGCPGMGVYPRWGSCTPTMTTRTQLHNAVPTLFAKKLDLTVDKMMPSEPCCWDCCERQNNTAGAWQSSWSLWPLPRPRPGHHVKKI